MPTILIVVLLAGRDTDVFIYTSDKQTNIPEWIFYLFYTRYDLTAAIMIGVLGFSILSSFFIFAPIKQFNINKIYNNLNISKEKFYSAIYLINFIQVFILTNIALLVYNYGILKG